MNLRRLFISSKDNLPNWIWSENCIYRIHNDYTNKDYIGQTKSLYKRFLSSSWSHRNNYIAGIDMDLYNDMYHYGLNHFHLNLLEVNCSDLNSMEEYWIYFFNSYESGYNSNSGGNNTEHLHTEEVTQKILAAGDGKYSMHSPDARMASAVTMISTTLSYYADELIDSGLELSIYNLCWKTSNKHMRSGLIPRALHHLDAIVQSDLRDDIKNILLEISSNGIPPDNEYNTKCDLLISSIYYRVKYLHDNNQEINLFNYCWNTWDYHQCINRHLPNIISNKDILQRNHNWNPNYDFLFQYSLDDFWWRFNTTLNKLFNSINKNLNKLESQGLEITPYNYANYTQKTARWKHIPNALSRYEELIEDLRCTDTIKNLFNYYKKYGY